MRKTLLFNIYGGKQWIGGVYYLRNVLFQLQQNTQLRKDYRLSAWVEDETTEHFRCLEDISVHRLRMHGVIGKLEKCVPIVIHPQSFLYPGSSCGRLAHFLARVFRVRVINWIPDFQHNVHPEFFTAEECAQRTHIFQGYHESSAPLILSSHSALNDLEKYYGHRDNVYVMPFVSYIEPELRKINRSLEQQVLNHYKLNSIRYICVCNQFWKHKNHVTVLKAIRILSQNQKVSNIRFVFTGYPKDYRNPEYFQELLELLEDPTIKPYCDILGFIDRIDQLILMKNAMCIIQPSLFEGWGTVVEDAKVLDKLILLSDIPVHREQMNENCMLFSAKDPGDLAEKIVQISAINHEDDIEKGIADMYRHAEAYAKVFEKMLRDQEEKH